MLLLNIFLDFFQIILIILFGLIIGSFLGVVIHRLPIIINYSLNKELKYIFPKRSSENNFPKIYNLWTPRSSCPNCGHILGILEIIPVISWIILRGRCLHCRKYINIIYIFIEIISSIFAVLILIKFKFSLKALFAFILFSYLISATLIDIKHKLLPDSITLSLLWIGLIINIHETFASLDNAVLGAIFGYIIFWSIYWVFKIIRGIDAIGYGDFKLLSALGGWFGLTLLPQIIIIASSIGIIFSILLVLIKLMKFNDRIAFGPYLSIAGILTLFFGDFTFYLIKLCLQLY